MQYLVRCQRLIILLMLPALVQLCLKADAFAGDEDSAGDEVKTSNVRWTVKEDVITITYDLDASLDALYKISVTMKREGDESFNVVPKTAEGALGEGFFGGKDKQIQWYFRRDYPKGFQGEGYYFEIVVEELSQDNNMLYYALGGAAIVGGVVAFILTKSAGVTATDNLPPPPGRP